MSGHMYAQIQEQHSWFSKFNLNEAVQEELRFWLQNINSLNGCPMWFRSSAVRIAYSDASNTVYGGFIVELGSHIAAQGSWDTVEAIQSSTMREIVAVRATIVCSQIKGFVCQVVYRQSERSKHD